jgi:predicted glycosyltransferase
MNEQEEQLTEEVKFAQMGLQVLNNEAYKSALTARRAQIFDVFCNTGKDQGDVREEAWRTMKNLDALEEYFQQVLTTGKMAEDQLKDLNLGE